MMDYNLRKVDKKDGKQVIDIFNYYIENSFAAFLDNQMSYDKFEALVDLFKGYPFYVIEDEKKGVIGFGFLGTYHPSIVFSRTAEVTYFILPSHTRKGLGTELLNILTVEAKKMGIFTLLANISSLNQPSINFHLARGFKECGRFESIGRKKGTEFDIVWVQKFI
jgi:phosphinothricin acetyltransferase